MAEIIVNIRATEIRSMKYVNNFSGNPGEKMKLVVKSGANVTCNPETPTKAAVFIKFIAQTENGSINFELETATPIEVSSFVDNLDEIIKTKYMNVIMLTVNEKIRTTAAMVGLTINAPAVNFVYL